MSKFIDEFIKKNSNQFSKYKSYIKKNNWTLIKEKEFFSESDLVDQMKNANTEEEEKNILKKLTELRNSQKSALSRRRKEAKLQNDLVEAIYSRLKYFVKKTEGENHFY